MGCNISTPPIASQTYTSTAPFTLLQDKRIEGKILSVYDGDTCHIALKHPAVKQIWRYKCRLAHIDTPEIRTHDVKEKKAALKARNRLVVLSTDVGHLIPSPECTWSKKLLQGVLNRNTRSVFIQCGKFDKYGRLLVVLYAKRRNSVSINQTLVNEGLAKPYEGGTKVVFGMK